MIQLPLRYLRGKGSANAVPILSRISMVAIAVCSAAMIITLSVFNGLAEISKATYVAFYPDIKISAVRGKFFALDNARLTAIRHTAGVQVITPVIEDNVFVNNSSQQKVITLKGIDNSYFDVNDVRSYIVAGDTTVSDGDVYTAIGGQRILNELGADVNAISYIELFYPNPTIKDPGANPLNAIQTLRLHPAGAFRISEEFDSRYVLAPLRLAQGLFMQPGRFSSIEMKTAPGAAARVQQALRSQLGDGYRIETRYEQNRTMYMVMGAEKWAIYAILVMVLLIASFNMVGALSMLVLEKQKDIAILRAMGARAGSIRTVFLLEGMLWSLIGGGAGMLLGGLICYVQQRFGLLKLADSFVISEFPVKMELPDFLLVMCTMLIVGLLISWYPAMRATQAVDPSLKSA